MCIQLRMYLIMVDYVHNPSPEVISSAITIFHGPVKVFFRTLPYNRKYMYTHLTTVHN